MTNKSAPKSRVAPQKTSPTKTTGGSVQKKRPVKTVSRRGTGATPSTRQAGSKKVALSTKKSGASPVRPAATLTKAASLPSLPARPQPIKVFLAYRYALDLMSTKMGPVFMMSLIYAAVALLLQLGNRYYFQNFIATNLIIVIILFFISLGIMVFYNDLLRGGRAELKDLWEHWRRFIPGLLVNVVCFVLTVCAFVPFFLLAMLMLFFALASLNILKIIELAASFQFQSALDTLLISSSTSFNWLIATTVMLALGGLVALFVSLKYVFATIIVATEPEPKVGTSISYSNYLSQGNKFRLLLLNTCNGLINLCGLLFFGVGLIFTLPLTTIATLIAYHQAQGTQDRLRFRR